jgi:hypothetical protein
MAATQPGQLLQGSKPQGGCQQGRHFRPPATLPDQVGNSPLVGLRPRPPPGVVAPSHPDPYETPYRSKAMSGKTPKRPIRIGPHVGPRKATIGRMGHTKPMRIRHTPRCVSRPNKRAAPSEAACDLAVRGGMLPVRVPFGSFSPSTTRLLSCIGLAFPSFGRRSLEPPATVRGSAGRLATGFHFFPVRCFIAAYPLQISASTGHRSFLEAVDST